MAQETELKLGLAPRDLRALLAHPLLAATSPRRQRLRNTYFDTPDLALLKQRMAVRERVVGRQTLLTVKTAGTVTGGLARRGEWEAPTEPGRFDFKALVDEPALARELQALAVHLVPVFHTDFTRHAWVVRHRRAQIEVALDRGHIRSQTDAGPRHAPLLELELELLSGPPDALFSLALALGRAADLRPVSASKAERGYALFLQQTPAPVRARPVALTPDMTPVQAFRTIAFACLAQLQANETGLLQRLPDPEYVHQARVALRRLRSATRLFAPVLPKDFTPQWLRISQQLATRLGEARDWDVLATVWLPALAAPLATGHAAPALTRLVQARQRAARAAARAHLARREHARLLLSFTRALLALPDDPASGKRTATLAAWARERLRGRRRKLLDRLEAASTLDAPARHALRIELKKLRYGIDGLASLLPPKRVNRCQAKLADAQERLGQLNDLAMVRQRLGALRIKGLGPAQAWLAAEEDAQLRALPDALAALRKAPAPWK